MAAALAASKCEEFYCDNPVLITAESSSNLFRALKSQYLETIAQCIVTDSPQLRHKVVSLIAKEISDAGQKMGARKNITSLLMNKDFQSMNGKT